MKKFMIEIFGKDYQDREWHKLFECESYTHEMYEGSKALRLEDVNTYEVTKTGKEKRKQLSRGKYVFTELVGMWVENNVYVFKNGTDDIIEKFES